MPTVHCLACATEFVVGVTRCSDCGGPLTPGELPVLGLRARRGPAAPPLPLAAAAADLTALPDQLLCTVPGEQAETIARALTFEGITSLIACDGLQRLRGPGLESSGPVAKRRMVEMYVAAADLAEAETVLASLDGADLIGEQWLEEPDLAAEVDVPPVAIRQPEVLAAASQAAAEIADTGAASRWRGLVLVIGALLAVVGIFLALL